MFFCIFKLELQQLALEKELKQIEERSEEVQAELNDCLQSPSKKLFKLKKTDDFQLPLDVTIELKYCYKLVI